MVENIMTNIDYASALTFYRKKKTLVSFNQSASRRHLLLYMREVSLRPGGGSKLGRVIRGRRVHAPERDKRRSRRPQLHPAGPRALGLGDPLRRR